jgi:hypothetical protein
MYEILMVVKNLLLVVLGVAIGVLGMSFSISKNKAFYMALIVFSVLASFLLSVNISMP